MTLEQIHESMTKAYEKVGKCEATIERHKKTLANKIKYVEKLGFNPNMDRLELRGKTDNLSNKVFWLLCDIENKREDIKGAEKKLADAKRVAENWRIKYKNQYTKEMYIEESLPAVIKEYMSNWKRNAIAWQLEVSNNRYVGERERLRRMQMQAMYEYIKSVPGYEINGTYIKFDYSNTDYKYLKTMRNREVNRYLTDKKINDRDIRDRLSKTFGQTTIEFATEYVPGSPEQVEAITKYYEREAQNKMLDLMDRICNVVGEITDSSHLTIGLKGDIEGIIHGTIGSARIETISAGGYNIQCFHFRTLVHKIK